MKSILTLIGWLCLLPCIAFAQQTAPGTPLFMQDMTWMEIRDRMAEGSTIALVPIGGVEQGGPQLATDKHNAIIEYAATLIAKRVGNTLIAPIIPYSPNEKQKAFPGTISLRPETLSMLLEDIAENLKSQGFTLICFIGDSEESQPVQKAVAHRLNERWKGEARSLHVSDYANKQTLQNWAFSRGIISEAPLASAGLLDTSELLEVRPVQVRRDKIGAYTEEDFTKTGAAGDATSASSVLGRGILAVKTDAAVMQINNTLKKIHDPA